MRSHPTATAAPGRRAARAPAFSGLILLTVLAFPGALGAQTHCPGNLRGDMHAMHAVVDSVLSQTGRSGDGEPPARERTVEYFRAARAAIHDSRLFVAAAASAEGSAACLIERRGVFQSAAMRALPRDSSTLTEADLRHALRGASAEVLSTRYAANDRVGVLFGIGFSGVLNPNRPELVKVIQRDTGASQTRYIVRETDSRSGPVALTGIGVRFLDTPGEWAIRRLIPQAAFGSVQFGVGEDPVRGAALGFGWPLTGDAQVLLGWNVARVAALRPDLVEDFRASGGRLILPLGETEESILGTKTSRSVLLALAVPISLRGAFGGTQ